MGARCDSHWCVPDTGCPPAQEPELLFEPAAGSPWSGRSAWVLELSPGHELLMGVSYDPTATALHFHDLATGEESTLEHPPGVATCVSDPIACFAMDDSEFTLFQDLSSDGQTWTAAAEQSYAIAGLPVASGADISARQLPVWDENAATVSLLDLDRASVLFALPLPDSLLAIIEDDQGRTASLRVGHNGPAGTVIESAPLRDGAAFTTVYQGEALKFTAVLLTNGDTRYAVRENGLDDYETTRVERVVDGVPQALGTYADPPLASLSLEYQSKPLEPGPAMYALDCATAQRCRSFLIHLDPVSVEPIAQAPWPDGRPAQVANVRRLACGARDLVLSTSDDAGVTNHFWSLRLPGRAGLP
jgi:hypothetical protein